MDVREVNKLGTDVLESLTKFLNFALHPRHPIYAFDRCPPAVHHRHTPLDQGRNLGANFKEMVAKVDSKGCHLSQQALGPTEQVKGFQALLVRGEPTIRALVTLPIDVAVALSALGRLLNLSELVRVGGLRKMPLGDAAVAHLLQLLLLLGAVLVMWESLDGDNRRVARTCVARFSRLPGLCRMVALGFAVTEMLIS